jgi:diaminohydroxyphosphoribosylaminopyrimidine deaminase / 5-amino-6-(5-phosphoribosylamino)uracil reductase
MHEQFLLKALKQALLGRGQCAPNPAVGAIAVQNGAIIAQTWHEGSGFLHAEALLLAQIPPKALGVTLYSTLEPCNHWGKTPPCVNAIIEHGIEHVVFAFMDPNPIVSKNNSTELLRAAGIKVTHCPLPEIDAFYESYAYWVATKKPWVTVKMAQTLDGKIAGIKGQRTQLSNDLCANLTHELRARSDILLTTAKTIALDNPRMTVRQNGIETSKPVAIIDSALRLNHKSLVCSTAAHCHMYHTKGQPVDTDGMYYHLMPQKQGAMNLDALMNHIGGMGYHDVFVEAGGQLFSALHQQSLVNRTYLYITPIVLGDEAVSAYLSQAIFDKPHKITWQVKGDNVVACFSYGDTACLPVS